ncbi:MAG: beta-phosphoglucomutase [Candidatus Caccosoma sp.]|nr:beta-phosphoglucomutase [Candidatus Caccosoma sp.]
MIKGVIFDLDGVLVLTEKYHYSAWKQVLDAENIYIDEVMYDKLRGLSRIDTLNQILKIAKKEYSEKQKEILANKKNEIYKEYLKELGPSDISCDLIKTLLALKEKNIKLAIASSSKNATNIAKQTDLLKYFDVIVDGNQINKAKPDPEVFLKAANKLNLLVNECLIVEDAISGIDAGIAGGFKTVGISIAKSYDKTTYKIDNIIDLLKYI